MIHRFQRTSRAVGLLATLGILAASPSADRAVASDFSHKVAPVLAARCITCHA